MEKLFLLSLWAASFYSACAQEMFLHTPAQPHTILITSGLEPEWIVRVRYLHFADQKKEQSTGGFFFGAGLKFAPLILKMGAVRVELQAGHRAILNERWYGQAATSFYWSHLTNDAATMSGLGIQWSGALTNGDERWRKGMELSVQYTPITHIRHSASTRSKFEERYPDPSVVGDIGPVDGWYRVSSLRVRAGLVGAVRLWPKVDWQFAVGAQASRQKQHVLMAFPYASIPLYVENSLSYTFK